MSPSSSSFEAEFAVYKCYQTNVHGDTDDRCTRQQFIRFLVDSPLKVSFQPYLLNTFCVRCPWSRPAQKHLFEQSKLGLLCLPNIKWLCTMTNQVTVTWDST